jgi:tetratricopeptide (TPR) repeat protein
MAAIFEPCVVQHEEKGALIWHYAPISVARGCFRQKDALLWYKIAVEFTLPRHSRFLLQLLLLAAIPLSSQQNADALYKQSNSLRSANRLADALAAIDKAIALSPRTSEYLRARASLKLALRDFTGAEADAKAAVDIEPGNARAWNLVGSAKQQRKEYAASLPDFERAIAADPAYLAPLINKGVTLTLLDRLDEAETVLGDVLKRQPDTALAYNRLGFIALQRKQWREAVQHFTRAIALDANDHQSFNSRGVCLVELQQYAGARTDFQTALRLRPGFETAQRNLDKLPGIETRTASADARPASTPAPPAPAPAAAAPAAPRAAAPSRSAVSFALPKVAAPKRIQFANLPGSVYESAVSAGMEGMKLVLAPATEDENTRIERLWAPAFQFPCAEVVDYLNKLNPLLAEFLAYRTTAAYAQAELSRANAEALQMAALEQDAAVETAMAEVRAQAQRLADLRAALDKTSNAIRALGDPPDAIELMGRARKRAVQAYSYGLAAQPEADLEYVHRANWVQVFLNGSVRITGNDGTAADVDVPTGGLLRYGVPIQWSGDEFFYSGPTYVFDQKGRSASTWAAGTHLVLGKVSPDGNRLLSMRGWFRRDSGAETAYELREIDLRNREQSFNPTTLFLSNYTLQPAFSTASQVFGSTVRILDINHPWTAAKASTANLNEYRPFSMSVSLFQDPDVRPGTRPAESLAAVRSKLDAYWKRPANWARLTALSEEKMASLFPKRESVQARAPAPPSAAKPATNQAEEDVKERIESLEKDIQYIQADLKHIRNLKTGDADYVQFLIDAKESEILSKRDLIASLKTGQYVHTRTPFDDRNRAQLIAKCEAEVRQIAGMDHEKRTNDALTAKLDPAERDAMQKQVQTLVASNEALNPAKWRELNAAAYGKVQARYEREKKAADDEIAVWDNRIFYAEWIKSGADTSFSLLAGAGGYKAAELVYLFGTSGLEGGLGKYYQTGSATEGLKRGVFEGGKAVITKVSDTVDYAWTAAEVYMANPQAKPSERMANVASTMASKYATSKVMGFVNEQAAAYLGQFHGKPTWKPGGKEAIAAMKHKQQLEMDQALVKDFVDTDRQYRRAVANRAPAVELQRLRAEVERKTFSVHSSYGAKIIMKHQVLPADQRNFVRILREAHEELVPQLVAELRAGRTVSGQTTSRYDGQIRFTPIRNASSGDSAGIDFDLALVEQANYRRGPGGKMTPNVWLTRDGAPSSPDALRQDAQQIWNRLYRRRTGYSATVSMENITVSTHPEAYADRAWINVRQGRFTAAPDPAWAQQAADVTRFKANEMQQNDKLLLGHYQRKQEVCRGTAKDISTKLQIVLRTTSAQQGGKWSAEQKRKHDEVSAFWTEAETVLRRFGQGEIDPLEAERQIHLLSGGRGLDDLVDRAATVMEGYAKALPRP